MQSRKRQRQSPPRMPGAASASGEAGAAAEANALVLGHLRHVGVDEELVAQLRTQLQLQGLDAARGSELHRLVEYLGPGPLIVHVSGIAGPICTVHANAGEAVHRIKQLIESKSAIPRAEQILMRNDCIMENAKALSDYVVSPNSADLVLVRKPEEKLYAIGGYRLGLPIPGHVAALLDLKAGTWAGLPSLCSSHHVCAAAAMDGKLYAIGQTRIQIRGILSAEVFDPMVGTWAQLSPMAASCSDITYLVVVDGKLYLCGTNEFDDDPIMCTHQVFDPMTSTWTQLQPMRIQRIGPMAEVIDGKIYVVGGHERDIDLADTEVFDPVAGTWTRLPPMSTARQGFETSVIAGKLYAIGGCSGEDELASAEVFDPVVGTWTQLPPMATTRADFGAASIDGKLYVAGGSERSSAEIFDPAVGTWAQLPRMATARGICQAAVLDNRFYVLGGYKDIGHPFTSGEVFDPAVGTWAQLPAMPFARLSFSLIAM